MSDYEHHRGNLILIEKTSTEDQEHFFKRVMGDLFKEDAYKEYLEHNNIQEFFDDCDAYNEFFYKDEYSIYKVEDHEEVNPYDGVQVLRQNLDGSLYFEMRFYNGGTCLSEMIEESLEKMTKKQK